MRFIENRFKILGLSMLALCSLAALTATSTRANWLENGVEITANKNVQAKAHTTSQLIVEKLNFEIRCPVLAGVGLKIVAKSTKGEGKFKFTGCKSFEKSTGTEQKSCEPENKGVKGEIIAAGLTSIVRLTMIKGGALLIWLLIQPGTGEPFTTIELPEACALTQTSEVKGSLVVECGELVSEEFVGEECSVAQKVHLLRPPGRSVYFNGPKDETPVTDEIVFGKNPAKLQGIISDELQSGNAWSGDA